MTILTLLALLLVLMLVASVFPTRTPQPPVILIQAIEPAGSPSNGCLPLILLVAAVTIALTLL